MKIRKYILLLSLFLAAWISPVLGQDYVAVVCAGDTGMAYYVHGNVGSTFEWTVEGGTISRNYGDSIIVDWGIDPGEYSLGVQEISLDGCYGEPKSAVVLVSAPELELGSDTYICEGGSITIDPEGDYFSYMWNDGSTGDTYTATQEGIITCTVSDQYGCTTEDELLLQVRPLPYVNLGNDTSLCGEQSLYLYGGDDAISFNWSTGETAPEILIYQGYKEISVQVEDEYGCENSDDIIIDDCDPAVHFSNIMNAITPSNQDGINDVWEIKELQSYPDARVDIYDRWGRLIWRSEAGYPTPWDGRDLRGKEVPMDSYHYIILLNFGGDDRVIGSVTVIR